MMDHKFTELIGKWLATPETERDYTVGALYLLKLSGNQIMYKNIIAQIDRRRDFVEYQLQKYYNFRVAALTREQVAEMSAQVATIADEHHLTDDASTEPKTQNGSANVKTTTHSLTKSRRNTLRIFQFFNVCANCTCGSARFRLITLLARTPSDTPS